jgi:hypothetical protein
MKPPAELTERERFVWLLGYGAGRREPSQSSSAGEAVTDEMIRAGAKATFDFLAAPTPAEPAQQDTKEAEPTDEQIIAAARTAKAKHWNLRDEDCVLIGRAVLALAGQQSERPAPAGQAVGADEIHLAWRGALKACGVSEADRDAISQVVRDMLASQAERPAEPVAFGRIRLANIATVMVRGRNELHLKFNNDQDLREAYAEITRRER